MPPGPPLPVTPAQPERLRRYRPHRRVEVHQHQMITFQPRLEPHVSPCPREEPPAREAPQPLLEPKRPHRQRLLEPHATTRRQRPTLPGTTSDLKLQQEPFIRSVRRRTSSTRHRPPSRHRDQERANSSGKTSRRAALTDKGLSCVSRDRSLTSTQLRNASWRTPVSIKLHHDDAVDLLRSRLTETDMAPVVSLNLPVKRV